jgi:hypothetical protein
MDYGPDGSGMWNHKAAYSLRTYFKYSPQTQYVFRDSTNLNWDSLLITHLDKKIPMYYAGWSDYSYIMGHAFICDGYQGDDYYHFNWGWSGSYDGYFYTDNLTPGGNNFNLLQELIINCYPDTVNYVYPSYCNRVSIMEATEGSLADGSGEKNYQPGASCSWLIAPNDPQLDSVTSINLSFSYFDTELNHDIVNVYDGADVNAPILGTFSGNTLPPQLVSSGNKMFITFTSNNENQGAGFLAQYTSNFPEYCSGITTLTEPSGEFYDGSGNKNYMNGTLCRWKIQPANAARTTLYFTFFDTEPVKDVVKVFDLSNNQLLATLSGDSLPFPVESPSGKMFISFFTDNSNVAGGFDAYYESSSVGNIFNKPIYTRVKIYPNPVQSTLNIQLPEYAKGIADIEIINPTGILVFSQKNLFSPPGNAICVQLPAIKDGLYFIIIKSNENKYVEKLFIE